MKASALKESALSDDEREKAWKQYRKSRKGYLSDEPSFNAGWHARDSEVEALRRLVESQEKELQILREVAQAVNDRQAKEAVK